MKLSIIIPTIGRETLWKVLDSLRKDFDRGDYFEVEVLVVFDGCPISPPSPLLNQERGSNFDCKRFCVRFLETGKKVYAGGARNLGLEKADGNLVAFLGDDTLVNAGWFEKIYGFFGEGDGSGMEDIEGRGQIHRSVPSGRGKVLLGYVGWVDALTDDRFHQWLLKGPQFDFQKLAKFSGKFLPQEIAWKFFYTSNVVLERGAFDLFFNESFEGWGFEDIAFGYRLVREKNYEIFYDKDFSVSHDDRQDLDSLVHRMKMAQKNAEIFERLHPGVKIRPRGLKLLVLKSLIFCAGIFPRKFFPEIYWWREWKRGWIC